MRSSQKSRIYIEFGENKIFWLGILGIGLAVSALGVFPFKWALVIVFAYMFLEGIARPLVSTYANRYIASSHRATVISVQSMIGTMTAAVMLFLIGFLTDRIGVTHILIVLGGFVLAVGSLLLIFKPKDQ